jgi:Condensation domain
VDSVSGAFDQPAYVAQAIRLRFLHASGDPDMLLCQFFRLAGPLDRGRLREAVRRLVMRRDSLRSRFELRNGRGWQVFLPPGHGPVLQERACRDEADAVRWLGDEIAAPFELLASPVARFGLARLGEGKFLLGVACTHNVADGYSMDLIMDDLAALYAGEAPGDAPSFAAWSRRRSRYLASVETASREFWAAQFPTVPPAAALPAPMPDADRSIAPPSARFSPETVAALRRLAGQHRVSLYMVLLAAVHAVRAEDQGLSEMTYSVNVANRDDSAAAATLGCLTHRVLIRVRGDGADFPVLLQNVRRQLLTVLEHSAVPFRVVRCWLAEAHGIELPLSQLIYVVLGPEWGGRLDLPGITVKRLELARPDPGSEGLEFWFTSEGTALRLSLRYPPGYYSASIAAVMCQRVARFLDKIAREQPGDR